MIPLGENPAVLEPRQALTAGQIGILREIAAAGAALKINRGWLVRGRVHRYATVKPLFRLELLRETFAGGRHRAVPTGAGRLVVDRLSLAAATRGGRLQTAD